MRLHRFLYSAYVCERFCCKNCLKMQVLHYETMRTIQKNTAVNIPRKDFPLEKNRKALSIYRKRPVLLIFSFPNRDDIFSVHLNESDRNPLAVTCRHIFSDEIGTKRQFAQTAINQHSQLHRAWTA